MSSISRVCRICLIAEGDGEHVPIFEDDGEIAEKILLVSGVQIIESDDNESPALICGGCLKDLTKAIHFRNKAIRAEKYFKRSDARHKDGKQFEESFPENLLDVQIKLENDEVLENIKSEPYDPNYEFMQNIETMIVKGEETVDAFVDVFSQRDTENYNEHRKSKYPVRVDLEEFGSTSGIVRCKLCLKSFTSVNSHQNHMKTIHQKMTESEMHKCKYCNRFFKLKIYLNRHVARIHGTQKNPMNRNDKKKSLESIFNKEDVSLYCELCKQFFTTRGSLQKHVRVKHEFVDIKDRFVCDHCGSNFLIKYYLIRHIRVRHLRNFVEKRTPDQPTPCEVCGKILKNRGLLKPHMRSHKVMTANDYWYCDLCPRKFKTKGGCTWHIQQRHILKATFPCKLCPGVVYKGKWELKCHIKSKHTNIRDFKCEICGKGFMDKQKLQIHTRIHTGERPHACHMCAQTFIHQTDLRRHIWGHTGERPYKCNQPNCGKGFMKRSELINHENRCHPPSQQHPFQHYAM